MIVYPCNHCNAWLLKPFTICPNCGQHKDRPITQKKETLMTNSNPINHFDKLFLKLKSPAEIHETYPEIDSLPDSITLRENLLAIQQSFFNPAPQEFVASVLTLAEIFYAIGQESSSLQESQEL